MNTYKNMSEYIVDTEILKNIAIDNLYKYEVLTNILDKYFNTLNDSQFGTNSGEYRLLLENTLLNEKILIKKRKSKIDKILKT